MMKYSTPLFQMKVLVDGKPIQEYHKDDRTYVEGRKGSRFSLELTNLTPRRILAHPTVDGLSVMNGKEASRNDNTEGYVLMPHQTLKIPGWRLDNDTVADFFFAGGGGSYAEKTGKPRNRGVIGCAVWEQKEVPVFMGFMHETDPGPYPESSGEWHPSEELTTSRFAAETPRDMPVASSYCSNEIHPDMASAENCSKGIRNEVKCGGRGLRDFMRQHRRTQQNLGTGFGDRSTHQVVEVSFSAATEEPVLVAAIYYDDYEGLRSKGLRLPRRRQSQPAMPDPFPKASGCKPPHGWRG